jgi:hypothetical protein
MDILVKGAYGRDYRGQGKAREDWQNGKNFQIISMGPDNGRYCSIRDFKHGEEVWLRYSKLTKKCRLQ